MPLQTRLAESIFAGSLALVAAAGIAVGRGPTGSPSWPTGGKAAAAVSGVLTPGSGNSEVSSAAVGADAERAGGPVDVATREALEALAGAVREMSHPRALEVAFRGYFAYRTANPGAVRKPYLYFVDYGLPNTAKRGFVFDMEARRVVEGPFTVAHGRGSSSGRDGTPSRFSNAPGSAATSLGLYLAQETYSFVGKAGGAIYRSVGLRLAGLSGAYNDNARRRGVVAHGAPYVTSSAAGRSEGCPAMESDRAERLLPKLANGGMVFAFAPDANWMATDPWVLNGTN